MNISLLLIIINTFVFEVIHSYPSEVQERQFRKRKSEMKCEEYSNILSKSAWKLKPGKNPNKTKCEMPLAHYLIAGGETVRRGEFPHMVALGWKMPKGKINYFCAGSLISEKWILTAAHCTHGIYGSPNMVHLGSNNLKDSSSGEILNIKTIKRHPDYDPPATYADIALIEMEKPIEFGRLIKPGCLHIKSRHTTPNRVWVTGWGSTHYGGDLNTLLLKAQLDVISNFNCSITYKNSTAVPHGVVPSMMCAGDPSGGWKKDSCKGDSGGPLQNYDPSNCLHEIVGITSFGKSCAIPGWPGVYTRVWFYLDWIEAIVWPGRV